jgi:hypothetical protein
MTLALIIVGLVLALIEEFRAHGQSLVAWAVVAIAVALLWGRLG